MNNFPARAGWHWVKQGWQLFRKQPGGLMALFFCCMFMSLVIMMIPLGQIAPIVLAPLFSIALLEGCSQTEQGQRALPNLVLSGFRKPARSPLLLLGALNFVALLLAFFLLYSMAGDVLKNLTSSKPPYDPALANQLAGPLMLVSALYGLAWLLTCLAAPLVYWQKMKVGKALFFSIVSVGRGFKAFFVAAAILQLIHFIGIQIIASLLGNSALMVAGVMTMLVFSVVLTHCTLYASYRAIFGTPHVPPAPAALPPEGPPEQPPHDNGGQP